jgi:multiple antibiotic resistance protein
LAGPGSISLLITFYQENPLVSDKIILAGAITLTCALTAILLISSNLIVKTLGASGINALSRIIGFVVIAIGVEYVLSTLLFLVDSRM